MKHSISRFLIAFAFVVSGTAMADPPSASAATPATATDTCMDHATSQTAMDMCASQSNAAADKELNQVYQQVLQKYATDKTFIAKFKAAQKAWLAFRDAELEARYPDAKSGDYGSVYPMCANNEEEALTRKRIAELREWLKGTQEGDVCAGSYQIHS